MRGLSGVGKRARAIAGADARSKSPYASRMARPDTPPPPIDLDPADAAEIAMLYARCADYFLLQDGEAPTPADALALFDDVPPGRRPSDQQVIGWRRAARLCALAAILPDYPRPGTWYLGLMLVDPALRGGGLGRALYAAIEARAAAGGADEIRLAVLECNAAGERFWRRLGFGEVRRVGPDRFKRREHVRIEMRRALPAAPGA